MSFKGVLKTIAHAALAGGAVTTVEIARQCAVKEMLAPALVAGLAAAISALSDSTRHTESK